MGWTPRTSTKPSAFQENARKVAIDAFLEGKMEDGKRILTVERTRLTKPQAKTTANQLAKQGRMDDALTVLMLSMGADQAKRELAPVPTAHVGDILDVSWGYEETHIDFYQVVDVNGATATIRKIGKTVERSDDYSDYVVPKPGTFVGEPKKKRIQKSSYGAYSIAVGDHHATPWDGKPLRQTGANAGR